MPDRHETPEQHDRDRDHELGMDRRITRRDFLDGVALGTAGLVIGGSLLGAAAAVGCGGDETKVDLETPSLVPYPPQLAGLQGETAAALDVPHRIVDGSFAEAAIKPEPTGETYDLVVVGGGISGLSAAYFYRRKHPQARVLVLDNHNDFGGHARRMEFNGGASIGYLGTESIDTPSAFSRQAKDLLHDIGIRLKPFERYYDRKFFPRRHMDGWAVVFDPETWGREYTAIGSNSLSYDALLKGSPMAPEAIRDLTMLWDDPKDWLPGLTDGEKKARLSTMTYDQYLRDVSKVHPDTRTFLANTSSDEWGYCTDVIGAIDAWAMEYPGFDGLGLSWTRPFKYNSLTMKQTWDATDRYIYHFPEGGAGVSRLLLRKLIPGILPGDTMEDEVLAHFDYGRLDVADNHVRIRLASPVTSVRHVGDPATATQVEVAYAHEGRLRSVRAGNVVMACWYSMVPYICPDLPAEQKQAMSFMTRIPIVYGKVEIRSWEAFRKLGIRGGYTTSPSAFWNYFWMDMPVSMGGYEYPQHPDQPVMLHFSSAPAQYGMPPREGARAGRWKVYGMSFADIEREIRVLLQRSLSSGGFDVAADVTAITVGRWAHGYSFEYLSPWDNAFYPDGPLPGEVAARPFGRIVMANTDRSSRAYMDSAIDSAHAAVQQLDAPA